MPTLERFWGSPEESKAPGRGNPGELRTAGNPSLPLVRLPSECTKGCPLGKGGTGAALGRAISG